MQLFLAALFAVRKNGEVLTRCIKSKKHSISEKDYESAQTFKNLRAVM